MITEPDRDWMSSITAFLVKVSRMDGEVSFRSIETAAPCGGKGAAEDGIESLAAASCAIRIASIGGVGCVPVAGAGGTSHFLRFAPGSLICSGFIDSIAKTLYIGMRKGAFGFALD